jgi:hypothetical protein
MCRKLFLVTCLAVVGWMCGSARGDSIDVNNWSFEFDADGNQIYCHTGSMMAWIPDGTGYVGVDPYCLGDANYDPCAIPDNICYSWECYTDDHQGCHCWPALHGICYSYVQFATYMYQELVDDPNAVIAVGRKYILTVDEMSEIYRGTIEYMVSRPTLICGIGEANHVELASKEYLLKTWVGDYEEWLHEWEPNHTVEWVAAPGSPHIGKVLGVKLGAPSPGGGVRAYDTFDRVRVDWVWATDAYAPSPADQERDVARDVNLAWSPGLWAADANGHVLYFHEDFNKVDAMDEDANQGRLDANTWSVLDYDGNELDLVKTYYWRVVEHNDGYSPEPGVPDPPWVGSVWSFTVTGYATNPDPPDYATDVPYTSTLSWTPGTDSNSHDVYLGVDKSSVENASTAVPMGVYKGNQDANSYNPGDMDFAKTYYWRIDEVNENTGTLVKGNVWRFTVAAFLAVDDFDSYHTGNPIDGVWSDYGTGGNLSQAYLALEQTIVRDGNAMSYNYLNNADPFYAVSTATVGDLGVTSDWTTAGIEALTLYFHGTSTNTVERMYVALTDTGGRTAEVEWDDANDVAQSWKGHIEWNIPLQTFNDVNSVNISSIASITLGFGDKYNPVSGPTGFVYFDDIRLYPPRCVVTEGVSGGNYNMDEDCAVDYNDVRTLSTDWLISALGNVTASAPADANKLRHYPMDDNAGDEIVDDISTYDLDGILYDDVKSGAPAVGKTKNHTVAGKISTALTFDAIDDFVSIPALDVNTNTISFSAWAKRSDASPPDPFPGIVFASYPYDANYPNSPNSITVGFGLQYDFESWEFSNQLMYMWEGDDWSWESRLFMPGDELWSFIALTVAPDVVTMYLYDGFELLASRRFATYAKKYFGAGPLAIGQQLQEADRFWGGAIDDVRIYDYTLTPENVLYLALQGAGSQYVGMPWWRPDADDDGNIDGADLAALGANWLDYALWP